MGTAQVDNPVVSTPVFATTWDVRRPSERFQMILSLVERAVDMAAVIAASLLGYAAYTFLEVGKRIHYPIGTVLTVGFVFSVAFIVMLDHDGAYKRDNSLMRIRETERILRVSTQAFGILFWVTFFFPSPFSRLVVVLAGLSVPLLLVIEKQLVFLMIRHLHGRGYGLQNVMVYGAGFTGRRVFSALVSSPRIGLNPVAIVDDNEELTGQVIYESGYKRERSVPVIAGPATADLMRQWGIKLIVVGIPSLSRQRLSELATAAFAVGANVAFVPQLSFGTETSTDFVDLDGVLIASMGQPLRRRSYEWAKRIFDFCTALAILIVSLPLWLLLAILIRWDSKGPAFFCQTRVGRGGKHFDLYKFRSMQVDAPKFGFHPTNANDPRVTRIGRWLRRTSLDELPQLINVLKGDMSLVGPRPEMPFIVQSYSPHHAQRLQVIPGLTGLWQLSADRAFLIHENLQYDLYYIRNRCFFMDLAILLHTGVFAMKGV
jgi:exopolysaccharide biosynthesis polyprenyl glycosylphosphotransferase